MSHLDRIDGSRSRVSGMSRYSLHLSHDSLSRRIADGGQGRNRHLGNQGATCLGISYPVLLGLEGGIFLNGLDNPLEKKISKLKYKPKKETRW